MKHKVCFLAKYDHFLAANVSFLSPCPDGNVHTHVTCNYLKEKTFKAKREYNTNSWHTSDFYLVN